MISSVVERLDMIGRPGVVLLFFSIVMGVARSQDVDAVSHKDLLMENWQLQKNSTFLALLRARFRIDKWATSNQAITQSSIATTPVSLEDLMKHESQLLTRRQLCLAGALGAAAWMVPGAFAEELARTPATTEGPFYPDRLPLDKDNDLIILGDSTTPAVGEITNLTGRILSRNGTPMKNVVIEIWQVDGNGAYLHSGTTNAEKRDRNFQGYGRFTTNSKGEYRFRTVKPVPYPGRCPHIHYIVSRGDRKLLTSQIFIQGHPGNARDGIFLRTGGILEREMVSAKWVPIPKSKTPQFNAVFDIVPGVTPDERSSGRNRG